ncbi:unnamed protein product [Prorocentrum cordatum]|uniref:Uncharacterized protein n=1 Tax=Prorocentrum cordatum TaxID=2364126 RepID=A0ABN9Q7S7_9DINO|nr:unnamed protein product [Polarella glacialis]
MAGPLTQPYHFKTNHTTTDGVVVVDHLAVHHIQDNRVVWNLLGPLAACFKRTRLDVHKLVSKYHDEWAAFFDALGLRLSEQLHKPFKSIARSCKHGDQAMAADAMTSDIWTIDTSGYIIWMLGWASLREPIGSAATSLLSAFLARTDCEPIVGQLRGTLLSTDTLNCMQAGSTLVACDHVHPALDMCRDLTQTARLVDVFKVLRGQAHGCKSACFMRMLKVSVLALAERIHVTLPDIRATQNPLRMDVDRTVGGRKRNWTDIVIAKVNSTVIEKKASTAYQCAKVEGIKRARIDEWHANALLDQQTAGVRVLGAAPGTFSIVSDGARLGKPARETNVYAACCHEVGVAQWLAPQDVSDNAMLRHAEGPLSWTEAGKEHLSARVIAFLEKREAEAKVEKPGALQDPGLPNLHHLRALDNALKSTWDLSLRDFVADRPCGALLESQRRYYCKVADLPESTQQLSRGRSRRPCIEDVGTGDRRLEVAWGRQRRVLHETIDMGPKSWPVRNAMYTAWNIQGTVWNDPHHRRYDSGVNAMTKASLRLFRNGMAFAMNFVAGPWDSDGFQGALVDWSMHCLSGTPLKNGTTNCLNSFTLGCALQSTRTTCPRHMVALSIDRKFGTAPLTWPTSSGKARASSSIGGGRSSSRCLRFASMLASCWRRACMLALPEGTCRLSRIRRGSRIVLTMRRPRQRQQPRPLPATLQRWPP